MAGATARGEPAIRGQARGDEGWSGARRLRRRFWAVAALLPVAAALPAREAGANGADNTYLELFNRGVELMNAGRLSAGCPMLEESFRQKPLPGTLFALAECEDRWGKTARALGHYEEYLLRFDRMTAEQKAFQRQRGRDKLAAARKAALEPTVPRLSIRVTSPATPGAVIKLDGSPLAEASLAAPIRVDPGQHEVRGQAPGGPETMQLVQIEAGETKTVPLSIRAGHARSHTDRVDPRDGAGRSGPRPWALGLGAGVSVASFGVGIGFTMAAYAKDAEAEQIRARFGAESPTFCHNPTKERLQTCHNLDNAISTRDAYENVGRVGFVVGGAALAGTVLYYVLSSSIGEPSEGTRISPVITASQGGLHVAGHF